MVMGQRGGEKLGFQSYMGAGAMSFFAVISSIIALFVAGSVDAGYMLKDWSFGYGFFAACGQAFVGFLAMFASIYGAGSAQRHESKALRADGHAADGSLELWMAKRGALEV